MASGQKEQPPPGFRAQIGRSDFQPQDDVLVENIPANRNLGSYPALSIIGLPDPERSQRLDIGTRMEIG